MKIVTNTNVGKDKTFPYYAERYSLYNKQEIEDYAKTYGFRFHEAKEWQKNNKLLYVDTNIIWSEHGSTIDFMFKETSAGSGEFRLWEIQSTYTYTSRPFFKDMGLTLDELYEKYRKKYEAVASKYILAKKKLEQDRKLNDINTDEIELDLMTLAEKYNYEFDSEHSNCSYAKNNTYVFKHKTEPYQITFYAFAVKSKNIQCWQVRGYWPFTKEEYSSYVGNFDEMKQVAEGYMKMFEKTALTTNYDNYIQK